MINERKFDVIGLGIGPSNLSLAALLYPIKNISSLFFDKQEKYIWHKGLLIPNSELQVSYLKDLVTLVDPTNPFSFLNFLSKNKRIYQFITANFHHVTRLEYNQYYQWVCQQLNNLMFDSIIKEVKLKNGGFSIYIESKDSKKTFSTNTIVMGVGLEPFLPNFAKTHISKTVFHSSNFMNVSTNLDKKRLIIVGGGQTGAEIVKHYINNNSTQPEKIIWLSKRNNFLPLDDSPFVNDLFTPHYSNFFYNLSSEQKNDLLKKQRLFSDGISMGTLQEIYRRLYELKFIEKKPNPLVLMAETEAVALCRKNDSWCLSVRDLENNNIFELNGDVVIFCTGYKFKLQNFLDPIKHLIKTDKENNLIIKKDFSIQMKESNNYRIFIQNGAIKTRGIADPNLSLMAWRSASIINSIVGKNIYGTTPIGSFINWEFKNKMEYKQLSRITKTNIKNSSTWGVKKYEYHVQCRHKKHM